MTRNPLMNAARRAIGFTLVELMVVLGIVTLVTALALPTMKNSLREQRISRATGLVLQYIEEARSRAIGSGRPVGVVLERSGNDGEVNRSQVTRMRICNTPPTYVGDLGGSNGRLKFVADPTTYQTRMGNSLYQRAGVIPTTTVQGLVVISLDPAQALLVAASAMTQPQAAQNPPHPIQTGDVILLGLDQIPRKILDIRADLGTSAENLPQRPSPSGSPYVEIVVEHSPVGWVPMQYSNFAATTSNFGVEIPYSIIRQPGPSYAAPLDLSEKTVIDLLYSGIGATGTDFSPLSIEGNYTNTSKVFNANLTAPRDYMSVWLVFAADGSLQTVFRGSVANPGAPVLPYSTTPLSDVYLLMGRTGQVRPDSLLTADNSGIPNLLDGQAQWVKISRMSGNVSTAPNHVPTPTVASPPRAAFGEVSAAVIQARLYALQEGQGT